MTKYPFDRNLVTRFNSDNGYLTITGQFITEYFSNGISADGKISLNYDVEAANPQIFKSDYLLRSRLQELNSCAFSYLTSESNRSVEDVLQGLDVLKNSLWDFWKSIDDVSEFSDNSPNDSHSVKNEEISYRGWMINTDPNYPLQLAGENWLESNIWKVKKPFTWPEIYSMLSLWSVDESVIYLNDMEVFNAITWFERALTNYFFYSINYESDISEIARMGGLAKGKRYEPLKIYAKNLVAQRNWKSRRQAVLSIKQEVIKHSIELGINLAADQAETTITKWLKDMGLPVNV